MRFSRLMAVTLMFLFVVVQGGVPVSAHDKAGKQEQGMKEDFKDVGKAVKKDSKTAGHEIQDGFKDIGSEVKSMFKKK